MSDNPLEGPVLANPLDSHKVGDDAGIRDLVERLNALTRETSTQSATSVVQSGRVGQSVRMSAEAIAAAQTLDADLEQARQTIEEAQQELDQAKGDISQTQLDLIQAQADATAAFGQSSQATQAAQDAWNKAVEAEEAVQKAAANVRIMSTRGTAFKANNVSTVLQVTVYKGDLIITDILDLQSVYGPGSYLEWRWLRDDDSSGVVSSADSRLSQGGFHLTVSPEDVDDSTTFSCSVHGEE